MDVGCGIWPLRFWQGDGREAEVLKWGGGGALSFSSFPSADTNAVTAVEAFVVVDISFSVFLSLGASSKWFDWVVLLRGDVPSPLSHSSAPILLLLLLLLLLCVAAVVVVVVISLSSYFFHLSV